MQYINFCCAFIVAKLWDLDCQGLYNAVAVQHYWCLWVYEIFQILGIIFFSKWHGQSRYSISHYGKLSAKTGLYDQFVLCGKAFIDVPKKKCVIMAKHGISYAKVCQHKNDQEIEVFERKIWSVMWFGNNRSIGLCQIYTKFYLFSWMEKNVI